MFWNKIKLFSIVVIATVLVGSAGATIAWRLRSKTESDKSSTISGLSTTGNTLVGADGKDEGPTAAQFELLKHEIEEARKDRDREEYHRQIAQAQDDWQKGSIEEAKQLLANCSPKFRDWEWHYLQRSLANPMPSKEPIVFKSGLKRLGDMAISPNQKWIAQGHNTYERDRDDIGLRTWDINNGKEVVLATLKEPYWVGCVAFGPRGERIAIGNAEEIEVWDTATKTRVAKITSKGWPRSLSFSPDGKRLAAAFSRIAPNDSSTPPDPDVWDIATGKSVFVLPCQGKSVYSIEFSPDGLWIATGADDSTAKIWDAKTGKEQFALKCPDALTAVAFSPDSLQLATVCGMRTGLQHEMTVWHVATGMPVYSIKNEHLYWGSVAWSPNGRRLAVGGMGNGVKLIDAISGQVILTIPSKFQAFGLSFTPDGNRLYVADANRYEPSIYYWDATPLPK